MLRPCSRVPLLFFWDRILSTINTWFCWSKLILDNKKKKKKKRVCTFVGCLQISHQNLNFAHFTARCLHICGWYIFTDLHIWGRHVCTNVVVCTFEGEMFAQMWFHGSTNRHWQQEKHESDGIPQNTTLKAFPYSVLCSSVVKIKRNLKMTMFSRSGHGLKITRPNWKIFVSFSSTKDALFNDAKK